jgi:hypothetical protein
MSVSYIVDWLKNFCNTSILMQLSEDGQKSGWNMYNAYYVCNIRYSYTLNAFIGFITIPTVLDYLKLII